MRKYDSVKLGDNPEDYVGCTPCEDDEVKFGERPEDYDGCTPCEDEKVNLGERPEDYDGCTPCEDVICPNCGFPLDHCVCDIDDGPRNPAAKK